MKNLLILILSILCLSQAKVYAEDTCHFRTWKTLTDAADQSPAGLHLVKERRLSLESSKAVAELTPASSVGGQIYQSLERLNELELEANYLMVWEKKEKSQARIRVVDESLKLLEANRDLERAKVRVDLVKSLHRMQQIKEEQSAMQEARDTYGKLAKQLQNLPVLSPEQQLTLSIFQMAADESAARIAVLENEEIGLSEPLKKFTGCKSLTIGFRVTATQGIQDYVASNAISVAETALMVERGVVGAEAESESARTMQDIQLGPILRFNNQEGEAKLSAGLTVSFPLSDGRKSVYEFDATAKRSEKNAEIEYRSLQLKNERERWITQYRLITSALGKRMNVDALEKKHKNMEALFSSGRVNASLVIEGHRQIIESLNSRHGLEGLAIEALWNLHLLSGNIFEAEPK